MEIRPARLGDVEGILALVHAVDLAVVGVADFTADEVTEALTAPNHDPELDSWLAVEDGEIRGWAYVQNGDGGPREYLDLYAHPERGTHLQAPLLARVLPRVEERARASAHDEVTVRAAAISSETQWVGLLRDNGFGFVKRYCRMTGPLDDVPAPPELDGVAIRALTGDPADLRTVHAVLHQAFADIPDTLGDDPEAFAAKVAAEPSVTWGEWFLAEDGGEPVGALMSADFGVSDGEGWVRNVGVPRAHRGRGIARALLLSAFTAYAARGLTRAGLTVDLTNPTSAYRLYESVGLTPLYETDIYEKTITR